VSTGAEKIHSALHPEKSWFTVSGRGFDSRHLHHPWARRVVHGHDEGPDHVIGPFVIRHDEPAMNPNGAAYVIQRAHWEVTLRRSTDEVTMFGATLSGSTFAVRLLGAAATLVLAAACSNNTVSPVSSVRTVTPSTTVTKSAPVGVLGVATTSLGSRSGRQQGLHRLPAHG